MKKQQFIVTGSALVLFVLLFFFGRTVPEKKKNTPETAHDKHEHVGSTGVITTEALLKDAHEHLNANQLQYVTQIENSVTRGDVKSQQMNAYRQLAHFWGDSLHNNALGLYYHAEVAKLENSEKSLTFAARLLLEEMMTEGNPGLQNWLGLQSKALFEKALAINPANDSTIIGLGACYMFGNVSDNPMEGITKVREVAQRDPGNLYAQMVLGLGGMKSGQFDKAIERFLLVVKGQPDNLEAMFHLAEAYEQKGDKVNAVKWYTMIQKLIPFPEAKKEIAERIKMLQ
jgi:tetratricopeptide (TPR) repeat protein